MQREDSSGNILRKGGTMKKYTIEKTVPDYLEVQVDINSIKASLDLAYDDLTESINADEVSENAWEHIEACMLILRKAVENLDDLRQGIEAMEVAEMGSITKTTA